MLRIAACPWYGSQVRQSIVWTFPHSMLHLFTSTSCRQHRFWVERTLVMFVFLSLHWGSCLASGWSLFSVHNSLTCIYAKITPKDSLVSSNLSSLTNNKDTIPLYPHLLQISIHCLGHHLSLTTLFHGLSPFHFLSALLSSSLSYICVL